MKLCGWAGVTRHARLQLLGRKLERRRVLADRLLNLLLLVRGQPNADALLPLASIGALLVRV